MIFIAIGFTIILCIFGIRASLSKLIWDSINVDIFDVFLLVFSVVVAFIWPTVWVTFNTTTINDFTIYNTGNKYSTNNVEYFELDTIRVQGYNPLDSTWYDWKDLKQID